MVFEAASAFGASSRRLITQQASALKPGELITDILNAYRDLLTNF
jgi:hypothetical protein